MKVISDREIDLLIATKIMGLEVYQATNRGYSEEINWDVKGDIFYWNDKRWQGPGWESVLTYSNDIEHAWKVVEKIDKPFILTRVAGYCYVTITDEHGENEVRSGYYDNPAMAICVVALKVIEI